MGISVFYALNRIRTKTLTKKLKIITTGKGKPLVIIHGWGMNRSIWQPIKEALERVNTVYWVDLPGHGINHNVPLIDLEHTTQLIADVIVDDSQILGWSLGGLIAQNIAEKFPAKVNKLILVASSLSFVQRNDWQHAMQAETLQGFAENLQKDFRATLKRFLALQFMGVKGVQKEVKILRDDLLTHPPKTKALVDGLNILKAADFHQHDSTLKTHWILGGLDRLVPVSVAEDLKNLPNNSVDIIANAGHAPFISHPSEFIQSVLNA